MVILSPYELPENKKTGERNGKTYNKWTKIGLPRYVPDISRQQSNVLLCHH